MNMLLTFFLIQNISKVRANKELDRESKSKYFFGEVVFLSSLGCFSESKFQQNYNQLILKHFCEKYVQLQQVYKDKNNIETMQESTDNLIYNNILRFFLSDYIRSILIFE